VAVCVLALVTAAVVASIAFGASASRRSQSVHASSTGPVGSYSAHVTFHQTAAGHQHGNQLVGREGHGAFTVKLGGAAAAEVALVATVTGVPLNQIARGGSYKLQQSQGPTVTGTLVASFKAPGLGSSCLSFTGSSSAVINGYFEPTIGTLRTLGGTGAAARWRLTIHYHLTSLKPGATMGYSVDGGSSASLGAPRAMSGTCRSVARQHRSAVTPGR
jgi:hypothetical protein